MPDIYRLKGKNINFSNKTQTTGTDRNENANAAEKRSLSGCFSGENRTLRHAESVEIRSWSNPSRLRKIIMRQIIMRINAQYTPPTPTRWNCRVASRRSRRRCVHEFATSSRRLPTDSLMWTQRSPVGRDPVFNSAATAIEVGYDVT